MLRPLKLLFLIIALLTPITAARAQDPSPSSASPAKKRSLILLDNALIYLTHSRFFQHLRDTGHQLKFAQVTTASLSRGEIPLHKDKVWLYDNLFLFCTSIEIYQQSKAFNIQEFYDKGNNVFFAFDVDASITFRELANSFGIDLHPRDSQVLDFENAVDISKPQLFKAHQFKDLDITSEGIEGPILYSGIALEETHFQNHQFIHFLRGNIGTVSYNLGSGVQDRYIKLGKHNLLALGIQGFNNARTVALGSLDMLSNELITKSEGRNLRFAENLVGWLSKELGVVRKVRSDYSCVDKEGNDSDCPIRCGFRYSVEVKKYF